MARARKRPPRDRGLEPDPITFKVRPLWMKREGKGQDEYLRMGHDRVNIPGETWRRARAADCTLRAMAELLDLDAENCNCPAFVLVHRALACVLAQEVGLREAKHIMRRLVNYRGLHHIPAGDDDRITQAEIEQELGGVNLREWVPWSVPDHQEQDPHAPSTDD